MTYAGSNVKAQIVLHLAKGPMTIDRLSSLTRRGKSTIQDHLIELKKVGVVCIVSWQKTGGHPIRVWGIGKANAAKPPPMTQDERLAKRREKEAVKRELAKPVSAANFVPRRDPAAAWF